MPDTLMSLGELDSEITIHDMRMSRAAEVTLVFNSDIICERDRTRTWFNLSSTQAKSFQPPRGACVMFSR